MISLAILQLFFLFLSTLGMHFDLFATCGFVVISFATWDLFFHFLFDCEGFSWFLKQFCSFVVISFSYDFEDFS